MLLRLALELSRLIADEVVVVVVVVGVGWVWLGVRDEVSSRNRDD
jgi:uncharacterized membrane protein YqiK